MTDTATEDVLRCIDSVCIGWRCGRIPTGTAYRAIRAYVLDWETRILTEGEGT